MPDEPPPDRAGRPADILFGGPGNDALLGGPNYPWIAFPADDTCDGGPGVDRFIGGTPEGAGCDAWISIP